MFKFASLALLALALGARADLVVSTETLTECQQATFQITGSATGPFWAYIVDSNNLCGDAYAEVDNISGTSFNWTPNLPSGTSVTIALEAEDGSEAWSGSMTIGSGSSSCISSSSSSSSTSTTSTTHSTAHGTTLTAPANAVSNTASTAEDHNTSTSGASSRAAVGVSSMAALLGAAVMAFSL